MNAEFVTSRPRGERPSDAISVVPRSNSAFTIIEILLTLTITSVILIAVYGVLARTISSKRNVEAKNLQATIADAVIRRISEDLRGAFMSSTTAVCFRGDATSLHFVSEIASFSKAGEESAAFNSVGYELGENAISSLVFRLFRREARGSESLDEGDYRELYPYVGSVKFRYLKDSPDSSDEDELEIVDEWDSLRERGLPNAVELQISFFFPRKVTSSEEVFEEMDGNIYNVVMPVPAGGSYIADAARNIEETSDTP